MARARTRAAANIEAVTGTVHQPSISPLHAVEKRTQPHRLCPHYSQQYPAH